MVAFSRGLFESFLKGPGADRLSSCFSLRMPSSPLPQDLSTHSPFVGHTPHPNFSTWYPLPALRSLVKPNILLNTFSDPPKSMLGAPSLCSICFEFLHHGICPTVVIGSLLICISAGPYVPGKRGPRDSYNLSAPNSVGNTWRDGYKLVE